MFFEEKRRRKDLTRRILPAGVGQSHWREALDEQMSSLSHSGRSHWEKKLLSDYSLLFEDYFFSWKMLVRSISRKNEYYENNHLPDSWMGENCSQQLIGDHGEAVLELQLLDLVSRQRLRWSFENISGNISICSQEGIVVDKK